MAEAQNPNPRSPGASLTDITERKRLENSLRESEHRFATIFQASPAAAGISRLDTGQFINVNDAFLRLFGYTRDEVLGHTSAELGLWPIQEERTQLLSLLREDGQARQFEAKFRAKTGDIGDLLISAQVIELNGHRCLFGMLMDVSERNRLEEQLRESHKLEAIGHVAGGMAHEFNNILSGIMMNANLARVVESRADVGYHLREIETLCEKAAGRIQQLLAFSRKSMMRRQPMDFGEFLVHQSNKLQQLLGETITIHISTSLAAPRVSADPVMMEQVLLNLSLNARDAMNSRGLLRFELRAIEVTAQPSGAHKRVQHGRYLRLSVTDTGCGIDEPTMTRLFEPFFTTKDVGQGTGLGLASVLGIVQQHGGWVQVESHVGKGSTFHVYLPALADE